MNKINLLDSSIFNRIAAGEVADKPASVAKELIENSLDAGAKNIIVEIKAGGVKLIKVTDDGCGIYKDDIKNAFLPHATSKISKLEDLDKIATLGFRGEALPSIAAVSKVTMVSRPHDCDLGTLYALDNGQELDFGEVGSACGTTVTIEDIFDRIPARRKFLQKDKTEENACTNLVLRYILAKPNVAFKYILNDKIIYNSLGNGIEGAVKSVYDVDFYNNLAKIDSTMSDIMLDGYVGKPSFSKHSKAYQTLIVNGRYVINDEISYVMYNAYSDFLMKRQYPVYILNLTIPYDLVDINVHPGKMQIKFACADLIKKLIYNTVQSQVMEMVRVPKDITNVFAEVNTLNSDTISLIDNAVVDNLSPPIESNLSNNLFNEQKSDNKDVFLFNIPSTREVSENKSEPLSFKESGFFDNILKNKYETEMSTGNLVQKNSAEDFYNDRNVQQSTFINDYPSIIVGKLFNTYILVQNGNDIYYIDQHAAHEKLNYDRMLKAYNDGELLTQDLLLGYDFIVNYDEAELLDSNLKNISEIGFNVEKLSDNKYSLKTIPAFLESVKLKDFVALLLADLSASSKKIERSDAVKERIMQLSCKASIRGEDDLSEGEISIIVSEMKEKNIALFCPHGRPISVKISRTEMEKWFKRIV